MLFSCVDVTLNYLGAFFSPSLSLYIYISNSDTLTYFKIARTCTFTDTNAHILIIIISLIRWHKCLSCNTSNVKPEMKQIYLRLVTELWQHFGLNITRVYVSTHWDKSRWVVGRGRRSPCDGVKEGLASQGRSILWSERTSANSVALDLKMFIVWFCSSQLCPAEGKIAVKAFHECWPLQAQSSGSMSDTSPCELASCTWCSE